MDFFNKNGFLNIKNNNSKIVSIDVANQKVFVDNMYIDFPWEYEKSWIFLEVREYQNKLFYNFLIDWENIFLLFYSDFEEEILSFIQDIDVLIVFADKKMLKIIESIEAKFVLPVWQWKDIFLHSLSINIEEQEIFKLKSDLSWNDVQFINLK